MNYLGEKNYLPKLTIATIEFLEKIITPESLIFELGTGNSTIWFAKRAKRVVAFENEDSWCGQVRELLEKEKLNNVRIYFNPDYMVKIFSDIFSKGDIIQYDVVLLDGPRNSADRLIEVREVPLYIKPEGYLIVDDTQCKLFRTGIRYLDKLGWKRTEIPVGLDPWGGRKEALVYQRKEA